MLTVTYRAPAPEPSAFRRLVADHGMSLITIERSHDEARLAYWAAAHGYRETKGDRLAAVLETDPSVAGYAIGPQQGQNGLRIQARRAWRSAAI